MQMPIDLSTIDAAFPVFEKRLVENPSKVRSGDKDTLEELTYVKIMCPGQRDVVNRRVQDADKERWPNHWAAFQKGEEAPVEGILLDQWVSLSPSERHILKSCGLKTVEQVSQYPEGNIKKLGAGGIRIKQRALLFLQALNDESLVNKLQAENDNLKSRCEKLEIKLKDCHDEIKILKIEKKG